MANTSRRRDTTGTGHTQPQNARPKMMNNTAAMARVISPRGMIVLVASMVAIAPSGHIMMMSLIPNAESVPAAKCARKATSANARMHSGMITWSFADFIVCPLPSPKRG